MRPSRLRYSLTPKGPRRRHHRYRRQAAGRGRPPVAAAFLALRSSGPADRGRLLCRLSARPFGASSKTKALVRGAATSLLRRAPVSSSPPNELAVTSCIRRFELATKTCSNSAAPAPLDRGKLGDATGRAALAARPTRNRCEHGRGRPLGHGSRSAGCLFVSRIGLVRRIGQVPPARVEGQCPDRRGSRALVVV